MYVECVCCIIISILEIHDLALFVSRKLKIVCLTQAHKDGSTDNYQKKKEKRNVSVLRLPLYRTFLLVWAAVATFSACFHFGFTDIQSNHFGMLYVCLGLANNINHA